MNAHVKRGEATKERQESTMLWIYAPRMTAPTRPPEPAFTPNLTIREDIRAGVTMKVIYEGDEEICRLNAVYNHAPSDEARKMARYAQLFAQAPALYAALKEAKEALEWCLEMIPSPCRCLDIATPPHTCKGHKAILAASAALRDATE